MQPTEHRIAVDIGGTFTDLVLEGPRGSHVAKVLTTHDAPERGVMEGIDRVLDEAGVAPGDIALVIHGTTLATNALIERKGARTALLVTDGFRDSIEIAYEHRFEQYDLYMERPQPLVARDLRFGVPERLAADGSVLRELDESACAALAGLLAEAGIESVAICFLHAYANDAHERRAEAILRERLPDLWITRSSEVCPEIREYERMSTTAANAYVQPLMAGYLRQLEQALGDRGLGCPFLLMMSSGGVTTVDTAVAQPVRLIESGPAGGVILARDVAAQAGAARALSIDMGGTTAKLTLIDDLAPQYSRSFEVAREYRFLKGSGIPVRIPVIDMVEIGAGGGSVARVDALRRIAVGPDSAGSEPGPACYDQGGEVPTVTDADLVLGRIDPQAFAGGRISLDTAAAQDAIARDVASVLDLAIPVAAAGIAEIVDETMASAARVHAVENGKETGGRTLIVTGGAAPLHAARLADKLSIDTVIVPRDAGVGSAWGFLRAPIAYEVVRTRLVRLEAFEAAALNALFDQMRAEAQAVVRLGAAGARLDEARAAFMRYRGQGHEIVVDLDARVFCDDDGTWLRERFEARYAEVFGRIIPGLEIEALSWILNLSTPAPLPAPAAAPRPVAAPAASGTRRVFDPARGEFHDAALFRRADLAPGMALAGPAVVVEAATATVIPPGFDLEVAAGGHLVLTRSAEQTRGEPR
jgi:N-methylhydantoinase A